ncbi:MAG: DPP IV N-terminal domain-containing protein [Verrucomicrobia bacterium]|nr:DPP IV N-terminal domain-containing protein [Verrucomicrobiota bacterium]
MSKTVLLCGLMVVSLTLLSMEAPAQVRVQKSAATRTFIDWSAFDAGPDREARVFFEVLKADLLRSGWFASARAGQGEVRLLGDSRSGRRDVKADCRVLGKGSGASYLSKSYKGSNQEVTRLAHHAADEIIEAVTGKKGFSSTRIVMVGNRTGKKELYLCDADGQNLAQLTRDNSLSVGPNWAPDGRNIAYTAFLRRYPDVYMVDIMSGQRKVIAQYGGLNTGAAISPDGQDAALILSKDGNPELYVKNLSSGHLVQITRTKNAAEASPCWSPDGRDLVYVSDSSGRPQLYIVSRTGGAPRRLTSRGSENVAPDWGPSGLIAYASRVGGSFQICAIDPHSLQLKQLTSDYADYEDPSWAPDGRHIVCSRTESYRSSLYVLDTVEGTSLRLIDKAGDWYSPAWSPK